MENLTQMASARIEYFQEKIDIVKSVKMSDEMRDAVVAEHQSKIDLIISNAKN